MIVVEVDGLVLSIREEAAGGATFAEYSYHQLDVLLDELVPAMIDNASTFLRQKSLSNASLAFVELLILLEVVCKIYSLLVIDEAKLVKVIIRLDGYLALPM